MGSINIPAVESCNNPCNFKRKQGRPMSVSEPRPPVVSYCCPWMEDGWWRAHPRMLQQDRCTFKIQVFTSFCIIDLKRCYSYIDFTFVINLSLLTIASKSIHAEGLSYPARLVLWCQSSRSGTLCCPDPDASKHRDHTRTLSVALHTHFSTTCACN
jgi:hypothetical protein